MTGLAERRPPATSTPARARRADELAALQRRMGGPDEVRLAVGHLEPALAQGVGHARRARAQIVRRALGDELGAAAQRLQRPGLGDLGDAEVGRQLGQQLLRAGSAEA